MAAHINANLATLCLKIREELVARVGLEENQIIFSVLEPQEIPHYSAESEVIIQVLNEISVNSIADYSCRTDARRVRTFRMACRTRMLLDQDGQDILRLTSETFGHLDLEDRVIDALLCYQAEDISSNILDFPLRLSTITQPRRERSDSAWVVSVIQFDCEYSRDVDQSRR